MKREEANGRTQYLTIEDVQKRVRYGRSSIYGWLDPDSDTFDPTFPKQARPSKRGVRWVEAEIEAWMQAVNAARQGQ